MASNKGFLLLALLVALVLVVAASRDLSPTCTVKENGKASDVGGVDDVKQVPVPYPPSTEKIPRGCHSPPCCYKNGQYDCWCNNMSYCNTCCSSDGGETADSAEP